MKYPNRYHNPNPNRTHKRFLLGSFGNSSWLNTPLNRINFPPVPYSTQDIRNIALQDATADESLHNNPAIAMDFAGIAVIDTDHASGSWGAAKSDIISKANSFAPMMQWMLDMADQGHAVAGYHSQNAESDLVYYYNDFKNEGPIYHQWAAYVPPAPVPPPAPPMPQNNPPGNVSPPLYPVTPVTTTPTTTTMSSLLLPAILIFAAYMYIRS